MQKLLESHKLRQLQELQEEQQAAKQAELTGAGGAALLGMDLGVFAVHHAPRFCLCDHALLWANGRNTHS